VCNDGKHTSYSPNPNPTVTAFLTKQRVRGYQAPMLNDKISNLIKFTNYTAMVFSMLLCSCYCVLGGFF